MKGTIQEILKVLLFDIIIPLILSVGISIGSYYLFIKDKTIDPNLVIAILLTFISFLVLLQIITFIKNELKIKTISDIFDRNKNLFEENSANIKYFLNKTDDRNYQTLYGIIKHMNEDLFTKCIDQNCEHCEKYKKDCQSLFRNFLYYDLDGLHNEIKSINVDGQYILNKNIERYHTLAVKQMILLNVPFYNVVHFIGEKERETNDYDGFDQHFLNKLIEEVFITKHNNGKTYYEFIDFKINWLLVGNYKIIKHTYDYIIELLIEPEYNEYFETIKKNFKFYNISHKGFKDELIAHNPKLSLYFNEHIPNIGIFGDKFVFVDDETRYGHGCFFINKDIKEINKFFNAFIKEKNIVEFKTILSEYNKVES